MLSLLMGSQKKTKKKPHKFRTAEYLELKGRIQLEL